MNDPIDGSFSIYGEQVTSRLLIGSALYPSPAIMADSIKASGAQVVTVSLRRQQNAAAGDDFWQLIKGTGLKILPNTPGSDSVKEAVTLAQMCREVFATD